MQIYAGIPLIGGFTFIITSFSNEKLFKLEVYVMVETVTGRGAPLAGAPALRPLSLLLSIVAQLLIIRR